jgi:putative FmdB family regulatory protein
MPLYEYHCHRCGRKFDVRQRFADEPLTVHEGCGGEVERLISTPTLQFKGTGWYVTDYPRGGKSPSTSGANGAGESKGEGKAEEKTESKTGAKPESKPADKPAAPAPTN